MRWLLLGLLLAACAMPIAERMPMEGQHDAPDRLEWPVTR